MKSYLSNTPQPKRTSPAKDSDTEAELPLSP